MSSSLEFLSQHLSLTNVRAIVVTEIVATEEGVTRAVRFFGEPVVNGSQHLWLDVTLTSEEAAVLYRGREGEDIAAHGGVVVSLDARVTPELELEGRARDLIRAIQQLRKDAGLSVSDRVTIAVEGDPELMAAHGALVLQETNSSAGTGGDARTIDLGGRQVTVRMGRV